MMRVLSAAVLAARTRERGAGLGSGRIALTVEDAGCWLGCEEGTNAIELISADCGQVLEVPLAQVRLKVCVIRHHSTVTGQCSVAFTGQHSAL